MGTYATSARLSRGACVGEEHRCVLLAGASSTSTSSASFAQVRAEQHGMTCQGAPMHPEWHLCNLSWAITGHMRRGRPPLRSPRRRELNEYLQRMICLSMHNLMLQGALDRSPWYSCAPHAHHVFTLPTFLEPSQGARAKQAHHCHLLAGASSTNTSSASIA